MAIDKKIIEKKREDDSIIYRINKQRKTGRYVINSDTSQAKYVSEIEIKGFESLPSGLYSKGFGITASGYYLLARLNEKYGKKLKVCISANSESSVKKYTKSVKVTFNHNDLKRINSVVREIKHERKVEIGQQVNVFLSSLFSSEFDSEEQDFTSYNSGTIARLWLS